MFRRVFKRDPAKTQSLVLRYYRSVFVQSNLNLLSIVRGFMEYATLENHNSFPPFSSKAWHEFLYKTQASLIAEYPDLLYIGFFLKRENDFINPFLSEADFSIPIVTYGTNTKAPRIRLSYHPIPEFHKELPYRYHHPDLAEKMLEIAKTIPGFII